MLEAVDHAENSFVTLTYEGNATILRPKDTQDWLKRLRKAVSPRPVRYFLVGEYGEHSLRPHYHAALFGLGGCSGNVFGTGECPCLACSVVRKTWGFGHVMVGTLGPRSAAYIAGYVTKKVRTTWRPEANGLPREFARMSLRPGIGAIAMHDVASEMMRWNLEVGRDVPLALRQGAQQMPLGRYLRKTLRKLVGKDEKAPPWASQDLVEKLRIVRSYAWDNDRSVQSVFSEFNQPYANQIGARLSLRGEAYETL